MVLYHALPWVWFSKAEKFKAIKQFQPKDGQVLATESLLRLKTTFEALLTNRKMKKTKEQLGRRLLSSIFKLFEDMKTDTVQIPCTDSWLRNTSEASLTKGIGLGTRRGTCTAVENALLRDETQR